MGADVGGAGGFVETTGNFAGLVGWGTRCSGLSSATFIFGVRACSRAIANGFGAPLGVEENTSDKGWRKSAKHVSRVIPWGHAYDASLCEVCLPRGSWGSAAKLSRCFEQLCDMPGYC